MNEPKAAPDASKNEAKTAPEAASTETNGQNQPPPAQLENVEELRTKAAERDQFLELAQRTRAEFENYQKRNQREREQERLYMAGQLMLEMLPVLDNLERATAAAKQAGEKGPLVQGVGMVHQQFLDLLKRHGVTPIEAEGKPFDANLHQALVHQPVADKPPDTVIQVVEQGYLHRDRVLRPAKVVVSQAVAGPKSNSKK
jgi:molecular chaperone GrpE